MQFPHIKYIETLVAGRLTPGEIQAKLDEVGLEFPIEGIKVIRKHLGSQQPEYFQDKAELVNVD